MKVYHDYPFTITGVNSIKTRRFNPGENYKEYFIAGAEDIFEA
jgi:hypothetical protein